VAVRNRVRGAVLIFALSVSGKFLLEKVADIWRSLRSLKPGLNIGKGFGGESLLWKKDAGLQVSGCLEAISGKEVGQNIFLAREILDHEIGLGERFPPSAKTSVM
jgi:hypothetical protein